MQVERPYRSSIENELHFIDWRKRRGIEKFLFDLDDTIGGTRKIFERQMNLAYNYLSQTLSIFSRKQWQLEIETINNQLFEETGVNPNRWERMVETLKLPKENANRVLGIFGEIYTSPTKFLEGTEEGLDFLKKTEMPIGIVTHANKDWTWKKYQWLGLERFIDWDEVYIVDENGHKTTKEWLEGMKYFGIKPGQCAVVGDSPRSDINPVWDAGVRYCFLVEDSNQWSVQKAEMPPEVKRIKNLSELKYAWREDGSKNISPLRSRKSN
jgi:FMN phosphatase YigB (HAD superfamily)